MNPFAEDRPMARILLIDDEELVVKTVERLLKKMGYEVVCARNDQEALKCAGQSEFDLVVSDIRMPGKNGVEIMMEIKRLWSSQGRNLAPVIFLTGFADNKTEEQAQALSPVAYMFKPFDAAKLLQVIGSTLKRQPLQ